MNAIGANITQIQDLKPQQDNGTTVYIQGKVEKRVPLLNQYAYQIDDSTGKIWVVTNQTGLGEGDQVVIKGKVRRQSIPLGGKEYGEVYIEEE
jgi:stress response protein SCP2